MNNILIIVGLITFNISLFGQTPFNIAIEP